MNPTNEPRPERIMWRLLLPLLIAVVLVNLVSTSLKTWREFHAAQGECTCKERGE